MDPAKRTTYIIAAIAFVVLVVGIYFLFIFQKEPKENKGDQEIGEIKTLSELDVKLRPYVTLTPTSDGAEIIISIENMGSFYKIEYELTYLADNPQVSGEKIQRGATGTDVNTKDPKYKKSVLLGTASRGVRSPDKGIEDGKLLLHMFKDDTQYDSETDWNLIQLGNKPVEIADLKNNFKLKAGSFSKDYWVIVADTVGVPPSPSFSLENVMLPVYGVFSIAPDFPQKAQLSIILATEVKNPELYSYSSTDSKWQKIDSEYDRASKTLNASVGSFATFVVTK